MTFADREDAGRKLSDKLEHFRGTNALVLGLARGGVEVAAEVADTLDAELDVLVVRKVGAPWQPEYGIGAVAPDGTKVFDPLTLERHSISESQFNGLAEREAQEVNRRLREYRPGRQELALNGRNVILIDDGLATGITALAAAHYARKLEPARLVFAVPVCSRQAALMVGADVDEFVCWLQPEEFYAVGQWYEDFAQTSDEEVQLLLREASERNQGYAA